MFYFLSLQASPALFLTMNECFFFRKQALRLDKTAVSHDPDSKQPTNVRPSRFYTAWNVSPLSHTYTRTRAPGCSFHCVHAVSHQETAHL